MLGSPSTAGTAAWRRLLRAGGVWLLGSSLLSACGVRETLSSEDRHSRIETAEFLPIGGIEQWVTIRGSNDSNPLLLLVHGGPADVQSPLIETYAPYERDFVLVQWDQRGAGRTFGRYGAETPDLTLNQVAADGIALAEYLRERFPENDLIVLGHSWGTAIATRMVQQRPDLFAAYVGTGQISSWAEGVNFQFDLLQREARRTGDSTTVAELEAIGRPDPLNTAQYFRFTRRLRDHMHESDRTWLATLRDRFLESPGFTVDDLEALGNGMSFSGRALIQTRARTDLAQTATEFAIPFYVIQGGHDVSTPTAAAKAYFRKVTAPKKEMVVLEDAGHFALATHQQEFISVLLELLGLQR